MNYGLRVPRTGIAGALFSPLANIVGLAYWLILKFRKYEEMISWGKGVGESGRMVTT